MSCWPGGLPSGKGLGMYKCLNCGKTVDINLKSAKKIICPNCGYRILVKARPKIARAVKAV
jgi:DNA-directed RNA polymerase subunit P